LRSRRITHESAPAGAHPVSMLLYTCRSTSGSPISAGGRLPGAARQLRDPSLGASAGGRPRRRAAGRHRPFFARLKTRCWALESSKLPACGPGAPVRPFWLRLRYCRAAADPPASAPGRLPDSAQPDTSSDTSALPAGLRCTSVTLTDLALYTRAASSRLGSQAAMHKHALPERARH